MTTGPPPAKGCRGNDFRDVPVILLCGYAIVRERSCVFESEISIEAATHKFYSYTYRLPNPHNTLTIVCNPYSGFRHHMRQGNIDMQGNALKGNHFNTAVVLIPLFIDHRANDN